MPSLKTYIVVAALLRRENELLLVRQQGPNDTTPSWSLPGGRVEPGELLTEALIREVREETGLEILSPGELVYVVHLLEGDAQSLVFVFEAANWTGEIRCADPDQFILDACFLPLAEAIEKLGHSPWPAMREPILAYLRETVKRGVVWLYRRQLDGTDA
jgi:8-oxo-dGTP diphosphatase